MPGVFDVTRSRDPPVGVVADAFDVPRAEHVAERGDECLGDGDLGGRAGAAALQLGR